jgi:hypothetical protein
VWIVKSAIKSRGYDTPFPILVAGFQKAHFGILFSFFSSLDTTVEGGTPGD